LCSRACGCAWHKQERFLRVRQGSFARVQHSDTFDTERIINKHRIQQFIRKQQAQMAHAPSGASSGGGGAGVHHRVSRSFGGLEDIEGRKPGRSGYDRQPAASSAGGAYAAHTAVGASLRSASMNAAAHHTSGHESPHGSPGRLSHATPGSPRYRRRSSLTTPAHDAAAAAAAPAASPRGGGYSQLHGMQPSQRHSAASNGGSEPAAEAAAAARAGQHQEQGEESSVQPQKEEAQPHAEAQEQGQQEQQQQKQKQKQEEQQEEQEHAAVDERILEEEEEGKQTEEQQQQQQEVAKHGEAKQPLALVNKPVCPPIYSVPAPAPIRSSLGTAGGRSLHINSPGAAASTPTGAVKSYAAALFAPAEPSPAAGLASPVTVSEVSSPAAVRGPSATGSSSSATGSSIVNRDSRYTELLFRLAQFLPAIKEVAAATAAEAATSDKAFEEAWELIKVRWVGFVG